MRKPIFVAGLLLAACSAAATGPGPDGGSDLAGSADLGPATGASVLMHHLHPSRDGVYTDPALSRSAAATLRLDASFDAVATGSIYAQPLFVDGGSTALDRFFVATEENEVTAFDGSGQKVWRKDRSVLGTPAVASGLPCGNIRPNQGITGTPVIDLASRTLFFSAMTESPGPVRKHFVWGLSIDDGSTRPGFPVDIAARFASESFDSSVQGQRGALLVAGGILYVPYGGMAGDCGVYHGYVVGIPLAAPAAVVGWHTTSPQGGIWAPSGIAGDGTSVFAVTGNSLPGASWGGQESILRFAPGPVYSGASADLFTPTDWMNLDAGDIDLGGTGPVLIDVKGRSLVVALGKNGKGYLLDRANLGGTPDGLVNATVSSGEIINAACAYSTSQATWVAFKGPCLAGSGHLQAFKVGAGATLDIQPGWCAEQGGDGSPMVTTTDGSSQAIVWAVGTEAERGAGDGRLHGFDADTGAVLFAGGGANDQMGTVRRFSTPIAAKGRIFVAGDGRLYAFTP